MKDWFENLEARERLFVIVGGIATAVILLWGGLWLPLDRAHESMRSSVADWQSSLTDLRVLSATMSDEQTPSQRPAVSSDESPVVVVDRTLRELSLNSAVKRRQPTPNGIRVEFENVAFDQLVVWLGELDQHYGMSVQTGSFSLASRAGPGRINASLTLERGP